MTKYAIVVAGGSGTRMGSQLPKQFLLLQNKPVLMHTLEQFVAAAPDVHVVLVLPENQIGYWNALCTEYRFTLRHQLVSGGSTRFASVKNGLAALHDTTAGLVAVHDGVRPLVPLEVIKQAYNVAAEKGTAVAAVAMKDSVRELIWGADGASRAIDRVRLRLVQTPQTFDLELLRNAYAKADHDHFTDDASVAEAAGHTIQLIEGSYRNIKITTPEDLVLAETLMQEG